MNYRQATDKQLQDRQAQLVRLATATPEPLRMDYPDTETWLRATRAWLNVVQSCWDEYQLVADELLTRQDLDTYFG